MLVKEEKIVLEKWEKDFIVECLRMHAKNNEDLELLHFFETSDELTITKSYNCWRYYKCQ